MGGKTVNLWFRIESFWVWRNTQHEYDKSSFLRFYLMYFTFKLIFKDLEAELLSHRAALDKVSLDAISVNLKEDFNKVEQRWSCTLDRTTSMKQRIQLDITRWRNLAAQLEESAAWMSSREPKITEIESINLDTSVKSLIFNFIFNRIWELAHTKLPI